MEEQVQNRETKRYIRVGVWIALILAAEGVLAVALSRSDRALPEAIPEEPEAIVVTTPPPAPLTLSQLLGVSADDWELRYVSRDQLLPAGFVPKLKVIEGDERFDERAADALQILIAEARADGYDVYVCSGYRSYETQKIIYDRHVEDYLAQGMTQEQAEAATLLAVNCPGGSEHQLGLAVDLLEDSSQPMEPWIGGSGLMLWLEQHCAEYGFIIRYPEGKTSITGVEYEPWHLRYVGDCASYIMDNGLCLEEFLAELNAE